MYAASTGEHMLPTNAKLFAITQSSLTLLKTTSQFSSFYLTHYSAKPEEHSDARISSGKDPYFLYDSDKFCKKYGFTGLLENFRVRLTDISLSTSSHQRYIQYMADCIINLNLMGKHTNDFFERGLSSLKINNTSTELFKKLSFELNDTNCRVKNLHRQFH